MFAKHDATFPRMLSERPYLRPVYPRDKTSPLTWLLAAIIGAFLLEFVLFSRWFDSSGQLVNGLGLTISGLGAGKIWTLATYWLLHSTSNLFHVAVVLGGVFLLGRAIEPLVGARRAIGVFFGAVLLGGLFWAATNWGKGGVLVGGMAGVYGMLVVYAALQPDREFSVLLFFVFPMTFKPRILALGLASIELLAFVYFEVFRNASPFHYAPSAHLGGMMAGWIFFRYLHRQTLKLDRAAPASDDSNWNDAARAGYQPEEIPVSPAPPNHTQLRAEIDRILDKINSHGLAALSVEEKRRLDDARTLLGRK